MAFLVQRLTGTWKAKAAIAQGEILKVDTAAAQTLAKCAAATDRPIAVALAPADTGDLVNAAHLGTSQVVEVLMDEAGTQGQNIGITTNGQGDANTSTQKATVLGFLAEDAADGELARVFVALHQVPTTDTTSSAPGG